VGLQVTRVFGMQEELAGVCENNPQLLAQLGTFSSPSLPPFLPSPLPPLPCEGKALSHSHSRSENKAKALAQRRRRYWHDSHTCKYKVEYECTDLLVLHAETTLALLAFQVPLPPEAHAPEPHAARVGRGGIGGAGGGFGAPGELAHLLDVSHRSNPLYYSSLTSITRLSHLLHVSHRSNRMPAVPVYTPKFLERGSEGCSRVSGGA
jgi:hypothetical protein